MLYMYMYTCIHICCVLPCQNIEEHILVLCTVHVTQRPVVTHFVIIIFCAKVEVRT